MRSTEGLIGLCVLACLATCTRDRSDDTCRNIQCHADSPAGGHAGSLGIVQFERLSFDLRHRTLEPAERTAIQNALHTGGKAAEALYDKDVDAWLTKDAFKSYVETYMHYPGVLVGGSVTAEPFFQRLEKSHDVYYLPTGSSTQAPCADNAIVSVDAWWSKQPVRVCTSSYVPEHIFDAIGYCQGEGEPTMREPPRPGCGCGPMMIGCLPPEGDNPPLDRLVETSIVDEWLETAARIVADGRPFDDLLTTSRTWQSGLAEFLYARREIRGDYVKSGWSPALATRIKTRLSKIDVYAPARWVERSGIYQGSGIWWTALVAQALKLPVRPVAHHLLDRYLCMRFDSVNVDADAVLKAIGTNTANVRTLSSLIAAPMRFEVGCKNCHSPMDGAGGFMGDIQGPIYGSYLTHVKSDGEFYVNSDRDFRGKGHGTAALSQLAAKTPEFETCSVRRAFEQVIARSPSASEQPMLHALVKTFHDNGHRWAPIVHALLLSDAYRFPQLQTDTAATAEAAPADVPASVATVIHDRCIRCHNASHVLNLLNLPARSDVATWKKIFTRVSDYSMPPPRDDDDLADRFPLDQGDRMRFVAGVKEMLGTSLEKPLPPQRMPHAVWVSILRGFAEPSLGGERVTELLKPLDIWGSMFGKLTPRGWPAPYVLAIEQVTESVCREVAKADDKAKRYALEPGEWSSEAKSAIVTKLMTVVYNRPPSDTELGTELAQLANFHSVTSDWREAWVGLCSSELSGPRLFFGDYIGRSAR